MLIDNILFLRERFPTIRNYFSEHQNDLDLDRLKVLKSKTGQETIRYQTTDDKQLMVHSMYDPIREAERIIASHQDKINDDTHVFFYGIGMGYHIDKFQEMYPNNSYSIYEPVPEIFFEMANYQLLKNVITKEAKNIYIDTHDTENTRYLNEFGSTNQNIHLIVLPSYKNIAKEKYEIFHKNIREAILNRRTSLHTDTAFQKLWVINSLINFETVLNTPNMMKDIDQTHFKGKPAMIVSAGPSLADDMEHIKYIKDNNLAYIFSVGSAINSLIAHDVLPDAVFTYDPSKLNQVVFQKMVADNIDHIPMVFGSSVGYETLANYQGPKVHFITTQDKTSTYFLKEQLEMEHDLIMDSPSIAVMTFQVLNKLGADPIVFAGQNLGYLYDQIYSKGIEYDHISSEQIQKQVENAITTMDVFGNDIKTNISFNNMRKSIERYADYYNDQTFINTTKGGAAIKGIPFQPIENVIKKLLTQSIEKNAWWKTKSGYNQGNIRAQFNNIKDSIAKYHELISLFDSLLKSMASYTEIRNKSQIEKALTKFDALYTLLNENAYYTNFLSFYIRVYVLFMANEIKRLNQERGLVVKGEEIVRLFTSFIGQCKHGSIELEQVIEGSIGQVVSKP